MERPDAPFPPPDHIPDAAPPQPRPVAITGPSDRPGRSPAAKPHTSAGKKKAGRRGSKPGGGRLRFGQQSVEEQAGYVRQFLSDRLDLLFAAPGGFLRDVLEAVAAAEVVADALDTGDADGLRAAAAAVRGARDRLAAAGASLGVFDLLTALQWGLFPELHRAEFADEYAIRERIERERAAKVARGETPRQVLPAPPPSCPGCGRPAPRPPKGGLVPRTGGERVGVARMTALAAVIRAGRSTGA